MPPIAITQASLTDLRTLAPFLAHSSSTNLFTRSLLTPSSLLSRTAHVTLATWLYTAALDDPKAQILIARDNADLASQNEHDHKKIDQNKQDQNTEGKILGCVWLQYFAAGETWNRRYRTRFRAGTKHAPPDCVDAGAYARALKRLQEHREASMQGQAHTYVRAIEVPYSGPEHDEVVLVLLKHLEETCEDPVFFQYSPFLPAAVFADVIRRWRLAPSLLGAHGEARFSVGRGWQGWVFGGRGGGGGEEGQEEGGGGEG